MGAADRKLFANFQAVAAMHGVAATASTTDRDEPCIVLVVGPLTATASTIPDAEAWLETFLRDRARALALPVEESVR